MHKQILVFTDLDGTLLDTQTFDFSKALPGIELLASLNIPLIPVTSKTRSEIQVFREKLSLESPFVSENGGGIFFPADFELSPKYRFERAGSYRGIYVGRPVKEVLDKCGPLKKDFDYKGFSDMSPSEIASVTGLPLGDALLASKREFDEPVLLRNSRDNGKFFCSRARDLGLDCLSGGRFIHLFSGGGKGRAVRILLNIFRDLKGPCFSIALGDGPNDIPMLEIADRAVLMRNIDGGYIDGVARGDIIKAEGNGPDVWSRIIMSMIEELQ